MSWILIHLYLDWPQSGSEPEPDLQFEVQVQQVVELNLECKVQVSAEPEPVVWTTVHWVCNPYKDDMRRQGLKPVYKVNAPFTSLSRSMYEVKKQDRR